MERPAYQVGDVVRLRKTHPCGGSEWEILRTGIDFRIKCLTCGRMLLLPRPQFEKSVRSLVRRAER
ncbi:MAG: DUF951 domain-containing protein [Desulfurispora sp.]|uniref:DUF951 domain-containing protein n=1 Tax=Desulfurispora sp. TaxID=3014275 RepID=UPI0040497468